MDELYNRYQVTYPFQIIAFRSLCEHHFDKNHLFLGESHNFWEFSCILDGEFESVKGNNVYLLQPGDMMGCPPMVFHSSRSIGSECHNLNFTFEHTGTLPPILNEGIFYLTPAEINELKSIFYRLREAYLQEPNDPQLGAEAASAMTSFIMRLAIQHTPHNRLSNSRSSVLYHKIVKTMQETLCENLSIQEIAVRNAVSTTTIKDLFRDYAGIGPKKYYADMRGIEALRLLNNGMEIEQITEKLNYSSTSYFSKTFKKQFGMPPGQYRKKLSEKKE